MFLFQRSPLAVRTRIRALRRLYRLSSASHTSNARGLCAAGPNFRPACQMDLEGLVSKRHDRPHGAKSAPSRRGPVCDIGSRGRCSWQLTQQNKDSSTGRRFRSGSRTGSAPATGRPDCFQKPAGWTFHAQCTGCQRPRILATASQ